MDTETKLLATIAQAKELRSKLDAAIHQAEAGSLNWISVVMEQVKHDGPWRLVIGINSEDD